MRKMIAKANRRQVESITWQFDLMPGDWCLIRSPFPDFEGEVFISEILSVPMGIDVNVISHSINGELQLNIQLFVIQEKLSKKEAKAIMANGFKIIE